MEGPERNAAVEPNRQCLAHGLPRSVQLHGAASRAWPALTAPAVPLVSVIVPAYNEKTTILAVIERVLGAAMDAELIVVDDGSSDGTRQALESIASDRVRVFIHDINRGKGAAIRTGLAYARGQFVIVQDADLEYDPADFQKMLQPLIDGQAVVVYGSRYLRDTAGPWRLFREGVRLLNWAVWLLYHTRLTDEATCYKALPTALLRSLDLQCARFDFCPEVTAKVCRMGIPIVEVPISYCPRGVHEGKKIRMRDGWEALRVLWKYRHWTRQSPAPQDEHRLPPDSTSCPAMSVTPISHLAGN